MKSNSLCNHTSDGQNWRNAKRESTLSITSMITERIRLQKVLLPIDPNRYNFRKQQNTFGPNISGRDNFLSKKKLLHFENSSDVFRISGCCHGYCDYSVVGGFG